MSGRRPVAPRARPSRGEPVDPGPAADDDLAPDAPAGDGDRGSSVPARRGGLPPRPRGGDAAHGSTPTGSRAPAPRPASDRGGLPGRAAPVHLRRSTPRSTAAPSGAPPAAVVRTRGRTVTVDAARRFAERARERRRAALRPVLLALAALVVVGGVAWVLLWSPLLVVRDVAVLGLQRLDPAEVAAVVDPARDVPLARVDTGDLEDRLEALPLVQSAVVGPVWPSGLEVRVVERVPVAAVASPTGGFDVVDRTGTTVQTSPEPPADVPVIDVDVTTAGPDTVQAVTRVLDELPVALREQVAAAGGASRDGVVLRLREGAQVVWGGADQTPLKAEVLTALLQRPAALYDVSAPRAPVVRAG